MLFSNSLETLPGDIIFGNSPLEQVSSIQFLGVCVDNKLSWKNHINNISKTISRNIGVMYKLKQYLPSSALLTLYSSLISPYLNYGILAWGNTHQTFLDKLLLLQKKALRVVFNLHARAHTDILFFENNILKINDLHLFQLGQFMYNFNTNSLPIIFNDLFSTNEHVHNYPTRQSREFHLPLLRTILAQNTFVFTGPRYWNNLDQSIKDAKTFVSFKYLLRKHLLKSYKPQ